MDMYEELLGLIEALNVDGIEYAVCGGIALAIHGHPRFTKDIDLLVRADSLPRLLASVAKRGFDLLADPMVFGAGSAAERQVQRVSKVEGEDILTLDLLIVGRSLEPVWADRGVVTWKGRRMGVVSRRGLVTMKRLAGRDQDLVDIRMLEERARDE